MRVVECDDFVVEALDGVMVFVHSKNMIPVPQGESFLSFVQSRSAEVSQMKSIAISDGGGPTSLQRKRLQEFVQTKTAPKASVVTNSQIVRFAVAAITLFNSNVKVFDPRDMAEALRFLQLEKQQESGLLAAIEQMRNSVPLGKFKTLDMVLDRK